MNDFKDGHYFILLRTKRGLRRGYSQAAARGKTTENYPTGYHLEVLAGSLLILIEELHNQGRHEYDLETLDEATDCDFGPRVRVRCSPSEDVRALPVPILQLLRPIPTCKERLEVYNDTSWLEDGKQLKTGEYVFVKLKGELSEIRGILRFKGPEVPDSKGVLFGVELEESRGTCDGTYKGIKYFRTKPDHAVFVALHKVRRYKDGWQAKTRMRAGANGGDILPQQLVNMPSKTPLDIGERIVWMSDDGPEKGIVKWIGCLPGDISSNITVGVEFENKVGSGTGKFRDQRLFFAKPGHASLIPVMGLMKESEFDGTAAFGHDFGLLQEKEFQEVLYSDLPKPWAGTYQNMVEPQAVNTGFTYSEGPGLNNQAAALGAGVGGKMMAMGGMPGNAAAAVPTASALGYIDVGAQLAGGGGAGQLDQDVMLAQRLSQLPLNLRQRGGLATGATSGTNPLYEHSRLQEQSAVQPGIVSSSAAAGAAVSKPPPSKPSQIPDPDLGVGSLVQVQLKVPLYGIIRWIGRTHDQAEKETAGLEMEEELSAGTDGVYIGTRYFTCPPKKGLFVPLYRCSKDKRFSSSTKSTNDFGGHSTPDIQGDITPPEVLTQADLNAICGKNRGIQGHHNSCYLDATLFCMFYFTTVFDAIFNRPANEKDLPQYPEVQRVLKEGIVNPLRKFNYVRADKVLKLRELLDKLGTVPGMMGEEKDPEEFLNALLTQIMRADPILQLSSGQHAYFYQLFIEADEKLLLPTTQKLVELSFLQGNVKLKEVPPCLMIQMPRFGKDFKMFHRIVPSLELDITHIVENCPRDCIVCGGLATYECKDCYQVHGPGLNTTAFCEPCVKKSHQHKERRGHQPKPITTTEDFLRFYGEQKARHRQLMQQHAGQVGEERNGLGDDADIIPLPRETMELFAVICIQTSHFVSFVKCGFGQDAPWVFFDSMADRMGEQGGYNIPEVVHVPKFSEWLDKSFMRELHSNTDDKELPEHLRRVLCDGYMCMYQSPTLIMYQ